MNEEATSSTAVIQARNLTKVFRDFWYRPRVRAVRGIDFDVRRGEIFGLLGPNGSGKSTTIKMILGLLRPTHGSLLVLSRNPRDVRSKARLGYLPEETYLYPYLTSRETLNFYGRLFDLNRRERRERTDQLLEMIGLTHAADRIVGEFSKGMARRIGLAQALINDPELILLDEPTSGLDPLGTRQVKDILLTLAARGKTVVLSSHLLADVEDVCDRIAILYNGSVRAEGSIDELLEVRQRHRLTFPEVSEERLRDILQHMEELVGTKPEVDHPRRDLEGFFLDVVAQAREKKDETQSGVRHEDRVADYLAQSRDTDRSDRIAQLVQSDEEPVEPPPATHEPAPAPTVTPEARKKLDHLVAPEPDEHE